MAPKNFKPQKSKKVLFSVLLLVLGLGVTTAVVAYTPLREFFLSSFAGTNATKPLAVTTGKKLPISGTFMVPDLHLTSEAEYRNLFNEYKSSGINTLILTMAGNLTITCTNGTTFKEQIKEFLYADKPQYFPTVLKLAKEYNMKVYLGVGHHSVVPCFNYAEGTIGDEKTNKGKMFGFIQRSLPELKNMVASSGIAWTDPTIVGFYLSPEGDTRQLQNKDSKQTVFFRELAAMLKQKEPSKKILISPFQYEDATYGISAKAFLNLYQMKIDIVAPQDSMGTGVTKTASASANHFRALKDVVTRFPGKEAWANIETFGRPNEDNFTAYSPALFPRVQTQIAAALPYVSKMITWIYPHTMMVLPAADNIAAKNAYSPLYTPENAIKRAELRREYMSNFSGVNWKITNTTLSATEVIVTGNFGTVKKQLQLQVVFVNLAGQVSRIEVPFMASGSSGQRVTFPRAKLTSFNASKPYTVNVVDGSAVTGTPIPSTPIPTRSLPVTKTPTPIVTGWQRF